MVSVAVVQYHPCSVSHLVQSPPSLQLWQVPADVDDLQLERRDVGLWRCMECARRSDTLAYNELPALRRLSCLCAELVEGLLRHLA